MDRSMARSLPTEKIRLEKLCVLVVQDTPIHARAWLLELYRTSKVAPPDSTHKNILVWEQATSRVL